MSTLTILGAVYGTADVTDKVRAMVTDSTLTVTANNETFGDPWEGNLKSLVLVYRYGTRPSEVRIVEEHASVTITEPDPTLAPTTAVAFNPTVYGAAYGLLDVTVQVQWLALYGGIQFTADNATFSDSWPDVTKSMVVVYDDNGIPAVKCVKQGEHVGIQIERVLSILGAAYGPADVTQKVKDKIDNQSIHLTADNSTFGDSWWDVVKSLVVTYCYSNEEPQVVIVQEGEMLDISWRPRGAFNPDSDPNHLEIFSAAYGLADVTEAIKGLVNNNALTVTADNETFGDSWFGIKKTLVVTYHYGLSAPSVKFVKELEQMHIERTV